MKRPHRIARRTIVAAIAGGFVLAFAGAGLSQIVSTTSQDANPPSSTTMSSSTSLPLSTETETNGEGTTTQGNGGAGNGQKVKICHFTHSKKHPAHTISVSKNAEPAFLNANRKDHEGACTEAEMKPATTTSTTTTTTSSKPKHKQKNKSTTHGHGNSGSHGHGH